MTSSATMVRPSIAGSRSEVEREIDTLNGAIRRFRQGQTDEASFLEYRLRFGVYGMRQDGVHMIRSKLPLGLMAPDQLEAFADLCERFGDGVAHLTTRQDIQVHFIQLEEAPDVMRVLADARMTAREACGNVVRNVVASETAGIEPGEPFDVTPYGFALARFLLRHPDAQSLGRKFKISLAGTDDPRTNLAPIHDLGITARVRDGVRGFHLLVGGGLGAVPHEAKLLSEFVPEEELLPLALATLRVFQRHGERRSRAKARMKFLVAAWGIERFRAEVFAERARLDAERADLGLDLLRAFHDDRDRTRFAEEDVATLPFPEGAGGPERSWLRTNVLRQAQAGFAAVRVRVPRGDLSPAQLRGLGALLREHAGDTLRIAPDQSLLIRFVPFDRLLAVRRVLDGLGLGKARAGGLGDTVTCPGADTCKLGITSPRALSRLLEPTLDRLADSDERVESLRIKVSGCPNSCAQHHIADIGLFGAARTVDGRAAPHFMVHVGGVSGGHSFAGKPGYAISVARVPALRVRDAVERLVESYLAESELDESFSAWSRRLGRPALKKLLQEFTHLPSPAEDERFFSRTDGGGEFAVTRGVGECAGEVVDASALLLVEADERAEAAQEMLDEDEGSPEILEIACAAMVYAARALLSTQNYFSDKVDVVAEELRERFVTSGVLFSGVADYPTSSRRSPKT